MKQLAIPAGPSGQVIAKIFFPQPNARLLKIYENCNQHRRHTAL